MTSSYQSKMPLVVWNCSATMFAGFYDPIPVDELEGGSFEVFVNFVCPGRGPRVGKEKAFMPYYVPCLLKVAPLSRKMHTKTGHTEGKQRSAAHVTTAMALVIDVDGLCSAEFDTLLNQLRDVGVTFVAHSTHSHGREDKPGVRGRILLPVDRPLESAEYKLAWYGLDQAFCGGAVAIKDASGANLWQQQGVWVTHPDRKDVSFRIVHKAGVASADALIAQGRKVIPDKVERPAYIPRPLSVDDQVQRLEAALVWMNAEDTATWHSLIMACKAAVPIVGSDNAKELAVRYSNMGSEEATKANNEPPYDPAHFFENANPAMSPEAGIGTLLGNAKANALAIIESDFAVGTLSERGAAAYVYAATYHRSALRALASRFGVEVA